MELYSQSETLFKDESFCLFVSMLRMIIFYTQEINLKVQEY